MHSLYFGKVLKKPCKKGRKYNSKQRCKLIFFHIITSPVWNQTVSGQPQNAVMHPKKKKMSADVSMQAKHQLVVTMFLVYIT